VADGTPGEKHAVRNSFFLAGLIGGAAFNTWIDGKGQVLAVGPQK